MSKESKGCKVRRKDVVSILKENGINLGDVNEDKMNMMLIGCDLRFLYKEDIIYMGNPNVSEIAAQNRLATRRNGL